MSQKDLDLHLDDVTNAGLYWYIKTRKTEEVRLLDIVDHFQFFHKGDFILSSLEDMVNRRLIKIISE